MVARPSLTGKVTGYGAEGWDCYGCGINQPEGSPLYIVTKVGGGLENYRCEECCRKLDLLW